MRSNSALSLSLATAAILTGAREEPARSQDERDEYRLDRANTAAGLRRSPREALPAEPHSPVDLERLRRAELKRAAKVRRQCKGFIQGRDPAPEATD